MFEDTLALAASDEKEPIVTERISDEEVEAKTERIHYSSDKDDFIDGSKIKWATKAKKYDVGKMMAATNRRKTNKIAKASRKKNRR